MTGRGELTSVGSLRALFASDRPSPRDGRSRAAVRCAAVPAAMLSCVVGLFGCTPEPAGPPAPPPGAIPAGQTIGVGAIEGRVVFEGAPPPRRAIRMSSEATCRRSGVDALSEDVIVSSGGGIKNAYVHVLSGLRDVLFADAKTFRAPDRLMPATYARVGDNLAKGMNITEATKEGTGDAESNAQVDRDEDYNTRYASYRGYLMAFERTKPIPRHVADLNLSSMVAAAHAGTPEAVVDYFAKRFLSVPLPAKDRATFVEFFRGKSVTSESALRELLYLVLSTPEYQLS